VRTAKTAAGSKLSRLNQIAAKSSFQFWLLAAFLVLVFLTGGASRVDVQSLLILRPVSALVCAMALISLRREHLEGHKWLLAGMGAILALSAIHLVPLPPGMWRALPGRQEIIEIDALVTLGDVWRPLTLAPMNGWHALSSLLAPLAVVLLGIQLNRDDLYRLLPLLIALGAISGLFGLLQAIGSAESSLYFYRITNNGAAVGLFANRNHAAVLLACLFPLLSVFVSTSTGTTDEQRSRQLVAAAFAIFLVPLILVTGSRSGLFIALAALGGAAILYRSPVAGRQVRRGGARKKIGALPVLGGVAVICLGFVTFFFSRAEAVERLFAEASGEDNRGDFWAVSIDLFWKYFPWGSGSGSFVEAFQIAEPARLLDSTYLNHAHNDWIEIAVTFGVPGLLLLGTAIFFYIRRSFGLWRRMNGNRRSVLFARMAGIAMALIAAASLSDYPLRTPTMMCVFALLNLWFIEADRARSSASAASVEH
jgi:O-antigen ligase